MGFYRENNALKAQRDALERRLFLREGRPKRVSVRLRPAQLFAYLLTRANLPLQRYSLSAPVSTIQYGAARFRPGGRRPAAERRPSLDAFIVELSYPTNGVCDFTS